MSGISAAIIGGGALSAGASIFGANRAARAQSDAAQAGIGTEQAMFNAIRSAANPFIKAGTEALPTLQGLITPGPNQTQTLNNIPGFTFAQDWGQKAVQNLGSSRGLGGNVLKAGADYATGVAQQGWGNIVNALQGLVNTGTGALGTLAGTGTGIAGNIAGLQVGQGNAQAGAATATGTAAGNFANSISTAAILQKLTGQSGMYANPINAGMQPGVSNGGFNFIDAQA